jgi:hypothetical protein
MYGIEHKCDHPVYDTCTLFKIGDKGLAVIQQRFNPSDKTTWWSSVDPWLTDDIYLHPRFIKLFEDRAREATDGLYPTITIRQLMWALKMKPMKRERWETCFDKKDI